MNFSIRVMIVDQHQMFREGIQSRLEKEPGIRVVGDAGSAQEAILKVEQVRPTIVTLGIRLPDASGIEVVRLLRRDYPDIKILIITAYDYDQYVETCFRLGVSGYLLKDLSQETVVEAIYEIASGGVVIPPQIAPKVLKSTTRSNGGCRGRIPVPLTFREIEILEMVVYGGLRNPDIARRLSISTRTVEAHMSNIFSKLGARNRTELVSISREEKLVK